MAAAASTRSVYRALARAGNSTFAGDTYALTNFRSLIRETFLSPTLTPESLPTSNAPPPPTSCSSAGSSSSSSSSTFNSAQTGTADAIESTPAGSKPAALASEKTAQISPEEYEAKLQHWREVAEILRRNVVQGRRDDAVPNEQEAAYKLRITPHTELGDNSTIKAPPKLPTTPFPNRNRRRARRQDPSMKETEDAA